MNTTTLQDEISLAKASVGICQDALKRDIRMLEDAWLRLLTLEDIVKRHPETLPNTPTPKLEETDDVQR